MSLFQEHVQRYEKIQIDLAELRHIGTITRRFINTTYDRKSVHRIARNTPGATLVASVSDREEPPS
jgi:hypothetical protein